MSADTSSAARWAEALAAWAIPKEILDQAPESPWGFPVGLFAAHAAHNDAVVSPSHHRALEAMPTGGSVIDVGCGGGAMSLPLRTKADWITAIDQQADMLKMVDADVKIEGSWPDVAEKAGRADVVVCGHVTYNVPDLAPFIEALANAARGRVVVEMTEAHPLVALAPLWRRFWQLDRPSGPTADDALAVMREQGIEPNIERWERPPLHADVAFTRRRLCLPAERDAEVAAAIDKLGSRPRRLVTLWWDG